MIKNTILTLEGIIFQILEFILADTEISSKIDVQEPQ